MDSQRILGLILVAVGGALFVSLTTDIGGQIVVPAIGLGFLIAWLATRSYGYLVPAGILTGLGIGIVVTDLGGPNGSVVLGLGLGFLAIGVLDRLTGGSGPSWWWPFIPGGILTVIGGSEVSGVHDLGRYVIPGILIVIGLGLLFRRGPARPPTTSADR